MRSTDDAIFLKAVNPGERNVQAAALMDLLSRLNELPLDMQGDVLDATLFFLEPLAVKPGRGRRSIPDFKKRLISRAYYGGLEWGRDKQEVCDEIAKRFQVSADEVQNHARAGKRIK
jgi:hypothetical protein